MHNFSVQLYWKLYQLIFEGNKLKLRSFNLREVTHFYNKTRNFISDSIL